MAASYKPNWHPSSLLTTYYSDSDAPGTNGQNDLITSDAKSTVGLLGTGCGSYDRSLSSRRYALAGVAFSVIISSFCIIAGVVIIATTGSYGAIQTMCQDDGTAFYIQSPPEMLNLAITLIITLCTESTGFVHSISLRSALASESRLRFNTNLRLLTAVGSWRHPNGSLLNGIMAVLLILSYVPVTLILTPKYIGAPVDPDADTCIAIVGLPLLVLGIVLLLQVAITLSGIYTVRVLTWSCSPFDLTAALVHHAQFTPVSFRCMRCVSDLDVNWGPARPSETQPSAWHAHPSIRKVIIFVWGLVIACAAWAALTKYLSTRPTSLNDYNMDGLGYQYEVSGLWILPFAIMVLTQGPLTLALHCAELIVDIIRDERRWRCATTRKGLKTEMSPLKSFFTNPLGLVLFIAKAVIHWMFGISMSLGSYIREESAVPVYMYSATMLTSAIGNLCIALLVFTCFLTFMALRRPRGPQPATYGHLQTLANLVDEWSPVMWWGHKEDGIPYCHAGTSDHPLPAVKMDCVYAGYPINSQPHHVTYRRCAHAVE